MMSTNSGEWFVTVVDARVVKGGFDTFGKGDLYVQLKYADKIYKTKVAKNQESPVWNETFTFPFGATNDQHNLEITLKDDDVLKDDKITFANIGYNQFPQMNEEKEYSIPLSYKNEDIGILHLRIRNGAKNFNDFNPSYNNVQSSNLTSYDQSSKLGTTGLGTTTSDDKIIYHNVTERRSFDTNINPNIQHYDHNILPFCEHSSIAKEQQSQQLLDQQPRQSIPLDKNDHHSLDYTTQPRSSLSTSTSSSQQYPDQYSSSNNMPQATSVTVPQQQQPQYPNQYTSTSNNMPQYPDQYASTSGMPATAAAAIGTTAALGAGTAALGAGTMLSSTDQRSGINEDHTSNVVPSTEITKKEKKRLRRERKLEEQNNLGKVHLAEKHHHYIDGYESSTSESSNDGEKRRAAEGKLGYSDADTQPVQTTHLHDNQNKSDHKMKNY